MSAKYEEMYAGVGFGLTLISGCKDAPNPEGFDQYKRKLLRKMRKRETLVQITERINIYADFFQHFGYECPLTKHLKRTVNSGFPRYSLFVDAHFMAEMCAGILVAVTDFDCFDGNLILDAAQQGELCAGMGGREFVLKNGEIVLRDVRIPAMFYYMLMRCRALIDSTSKTVSRLVLRRWLSLVGVRLKVLKSFSVVS
jgi:DNA/RNA-binding domain of Phe-tRNA-synthetase-like protein